MINNGEKSKPLERYPFMENDLKKYDTMQEDIKKLQGDVQEISEILRALSENVINLNSEVENLTEVTQYNNFFTLGGSIDYLEVTACKAFKVGNAVQVYMALKITEVPQRWENNIGNLNYAILPKPVNMFGVTDPRFIGKVSSGNGLITLIPVNPDYIQVDRIIGLSGFYVVDKGGG